MKYIIYIMKLWKVRVSACEDLTKIFKTSSKESPEFSNYTSYFKKMVSDSNLPAQIAALGTLQAYLENAPEDLATKYIQFNNIFLIYLSYKK